MIGRDSISSCVAPSMEKSMEERYKRCIFSDMKLAIDYLKVLDDQLKLLHPDIYYKIRQLI